MNNSQIYKKTIGFSFRKLLWDILAVIALFGLSAVGFVIAETTNNNGLIGLGIGLVIGAIIMYIILHYVAYSYKAGQIAMMTEGVTKGKLPDDVIGTGKKIVKKRFTTVAAYYAVTGAIKGIFRQLGDAITSVGKAVGGDTGNAVGSTISAVIQVIVAYLCDCCLGWVFYRSDEKPFKATLEGAVLFFRHGKTLAKNLGRVFGIGILSFIIIGGVFGGVTYLIAQYFPEAFADFANKIAESAANSGNNIPEFLTQATNLMIGCSVIVGVLAWSFIQSNFIRPFVLVGVLRNYINSGIDDVPTEASFKELDSKSSKFKKLHEKAEKE